MSGGTFSPKTASAEEWLARIIVTDDRWKVKSFGGKIGLPLFPNGNPNETLISDMMVSIRGCSRVEAIHGLHRVASYFKQINGQLDFIRQTTHVSSQPKILMAPATDRPNLDDIVHWEILKARLEAAGATVHAMTNTDKKDSNYSEVWTRDRYVLRADGTAIFPRKLTDFTDYPSVYKDKAEKFDRTAGEVRQYFNEQGIRTLTIPAYFEGGNVLQHLQSKSVFVGIQVNAHGTMNSAQLHDAAELADTLGLKLVPIALTKKSYYHLDTLMSVLPDGGVVIRPEATDTSSMKRARDVIPRQDRLELPPQRTVALSTNLVTVNGHVFLTDAPPEMRTFLEKRGFYVWPGPHQLADSGPHCQMNIMKRGKIDRRSDIAFVNPADYVTLPASEITPPEQFSPNSKTAKPPHALMRTGLA